MVAKRRLEGRFYKAANGHESYEIFYAAPDIIYEIDEELTSKFGCSSLKMSVAGLDEVIAKCYKNETKLLVGWDNWSGFYIMADSRDGDPLVKEIGKYLDSIIGSRKYEKFIDYF